MKKLLLIVLLLLMSKSALADSVILQTGWLHTANSNYGDSGELVVRAEKELIVNQLGVLSGGLEYAYHGPTSRFAEDNTQYGDVSGHTAIVEAIYYPPIKGKIKPYALAGIGWGWWDFSESSWSKDAGISVDMGDNWCYKVGFGADYQINDHWSVNLEWAYFQTDIPKNAHYSDGSFSNILDTGKTIGESETTLLVGVRYRW